MQDPENCEYRNYCFCLFMFCWTLYILAMETIPPPPAPKKKEGKKLKIIEDFNTLVIP